MSNKPYPLISEKRKRADNTSARCPCGEIGKWTICIQHSWFRGDDEDDWRCDKHKTHITIPKGEA